MINEFLIVSLLFFNPIVDVPLLNTSSDIQNPTVIVVQPLPDAFNTSTVEGLESFLEWSSVNETVYDYESYNCVNFSSDLITELKYYGFDSSKVHLFNCNNNDTDSHMIVYVNLSNKIVFIEPQTDKILRYDDLEQHFIDYGFTNVVVYGLWGDSTIFSFNGWQSNSTKNMFEVEL